ncbi:MAG: 1-acyl-sn-glycerol-3-phosphate acyltransferase [Rhodocyclaceae bacterium]|nr:MAG: 1-acyl-sn-glycerol-3-phosphate acyltransferase [Rhodocyclaceae bacterium]
MNRGHTDCYYWRILATGLGFILFGLGALFLSVAAFPFLYAFSKETRSQRARWCIHKCFAGFMWTAEKLGLMKFEVIGRERLSNCGSQLVLANHPTLIDVVALIALIPDASCVVKQALWKNPFVACVVRAASYISNATPEGVIDACVSEMQRPHPLVIFPEGTRSIPGQPLHFQRGAAYIALKSGRPLLPVLVQCSPSTLTKGVAWYRIPKRKFTLRIQILESMATSALIAEANDSPLQARRMTAALEAFFTDQLEHHGYLNHAET